ncbi:MAG TPA: TraR/DksA C4-type zinc finger protein [Micromonosporaceae bacterium]|jgi:DnaK suppressor protein
MTLIAEPVRTAIPAAIASRSRDLHRRLADQRATIERLREDAAGAGGDDADHATASLLLDEQLTVAMVLQTQLDDLDDAATRTGYGICESCGEPIPTERLEIFPATTMCVACKSAAVRR